PAPFVAPDRARRDWGAIPAGPRTGPQGQRGLLPERSPASVVDRLHRMQFLRVDTVPLVSLLPACLCRRAPANSQRGFTSNREFGGPDLTSLQAASGRGRALEKSARNDSTHEGHRTQSRAEWVLN